MRSEAHMTWKKIQSDKKSYYECGICGGRMDFKYAYCGFCGAEATNPEYDDNLEEND